jgi:hypothetical protein
VWRKLASKFSSAHAIALLALVVAIGGVAIARIPSSTGEITACYKRHGGDVRLIGEAKKCDDTERRIKWSQRGPAGAPGKPGADAAVSSHDAKPDFVFTKDTGGVRLGGPSLTVNVPTAGAIVLVVADVELRLATNRCSDTETANASYLLYRDGQFIAAGNNCTATFLSRRTTYVDTPGPGPHTYEILYQSEDPSTEAQFKNRRLRVAVIK